jgi:hypothetical protein
MNQYHKIQTVYLRDPDTGYKTLLEGKFALPEFEYLAMNRWVFTEKVDGTNIRVMCDGYNVSFAGKTNQANIPVPLAKRLAELFPADFLHDVLPTDSSICLYGEGYGEKIQSGGKYTRGQDFVLFDVNINGIWLDRNSVFDIAAKLHIGAVPIVGEGTLYDAVEMTRTGFDSIWGDFIAEGLVMRPFVELQDRRGSRIISKIKHKDFAR